MATKVIMTNSNAINATFGNLERGEWFIADDKELYCKVAFSEEENNAFYPGGSCLTTFDKCEKVIPVDEVEICF